MLFRGGKMLENIISGFMEKINEIVENSAKKLEKEHDFSSIERELREISDRFAVSILEIILNDYLNNTTFLKILKEIGGRSAMRFKGYREITIRIYNGGKIRIMSPYFTKSQPKRGKKKRGPNGRGVHLGLEVLGIIGKCSRDFISYVVKSAVLSPSFSICGQVLSDQGIRINVKTIRRMCRDLGEIGLEFRGRISLSKGEVTEGGTLVIGIDGGRLRERIRKRGRKKEDQKRQGYYSEWKEPKLFTIYLLDNEGNKVKTFNPLHDATMDDHKGVFMLLKRYLMSLDLTLIDRIVFTGDGGPWIWSDVELLLEELKINSDKVYQVLDYTHAQQNLQEIIDLLPKKLGKKKEKISKSWKDMLWKGDIQGIFNGICEILKGKKREQAIKKWNNYFDKHKKRMQYRFFKEKNIPCGSGCVESAIRRVINLRLKSAGSFWTRSMAEYFLFLRSQLLSGRWNIFMNNAARRMGKFEIKQTVSYVNDNEQKHSINIQTS
jgi:hypothetical protein